MRKIFDPVEAIFDKIESFYFDTGRAPEGILLSPKTYRRLVEIRSDESRVDGLVIGCAPIQFFPTPWGDIRLQIDEMLEDTLIEIEYRS
jgi:hypothetical protein